MDRPEHLDHSEHIDHPGRDFLDEFEAGQLAIEFDGESPEAVIEWALDRWGRRAGLCTSFQAEGMVLLDMAWQIDPNIHVFTVTRDGCTRRPTTSSTGSGTITKSTSRCISPTCSRWRTWWAPTA